MGTSVISKKRAGQPWVKPGHDAEGVNMHDRIVL
jgi:hypothetical protein